jgi:hypothetical protein
MDTTDTTSKISITDKIISLFLNQLEKIPRGPKFYLISANVLLVFFLILLNNLEILPVKNLGNFLFFVGLAFIFALYRPGWAFLFFVGTIALENINIAPPELGFSVRPYQFAAALTIAAVLARFLLKRLNFSFPRWKKIDWAFAIFAAAGFISCLFAEDKGIAFKQSAIAATFVAIYFLARLFIQNINDLKKIIPFFLSSSAVVVLYGIWQNWRFARGAAHFEAMPGRPNATFPEADWLGIFLVLLLAVLYAVVYKITNYQFPITNKMSNVKCQMSVVGYWLLIVGYFVLLILTVSRSAWLGVLAVSILYLAFSIKHFVFEQKNLPALRRIWALIISAGFLSIAVVYIFNLTSFQLVNRFQSAGTGLQKITVSCKEDIALPEKINYSEELIRYGCRHINLEEIKLEEMRGYYIKEIYRDDPNIMARKEIYEKSLSEIKKHPVWGIGWGNIGKVLGKDGLGNYHNASNIFLETWLGSGILGLLAFAAVWVYVIAKGFKLSFKKNQLFLLLAGAALLVPNFFNAGVFMGVLWLFFAAAGAETE